MTQSHNPTAPTTPADDTTDVAVVGGGPAGATLALQLARQGHRVTLLEQSRTVERHFRGESLSPDGVWLLRELGLLDDVCAMGALQVHRLEVAEGAKVLMRTEFADLDYPCPYPMEVPQPHLLSVLAAASAQEPGFTQVRGTKVSDLLEEDGVVRGVVYRGSDGATRRLRADLVVAADGRYSKLRDLSGLDSTRTPLQRDVVWFKMPRPRDWEEGTYRIRLDGDQHGLFIPTYPDDLRVGFNIPKGGLRELRSEGIAALHRRVDRLAPELSSTLRASVQDWSATTVLDIFTVTTAQWSRPGLVLIGDAAHTLTPILGQGVNHALTDAVTLAAELAPALRCSGRRRRELLDCAAVTFQNERRPAVEKSRQLQLRQERAFTVGSPLAVAGRSGIYRILDRSDRLRRRTLAAAYFQSQPRLAG